MKRTPLYEQVRVYIIEQIKSGRWPASYQVPPERILAEQFQVSRITAKNAILGLVNDGYLYRHSGKGTFVAEQNLAEPSPAPVATEPTASKKLIGFIMPSVEWHYANLLFAAFESELAKSGYHLLYKRVKKTEEDESRAIRELLELKVDGLVIVASQGEHFNEDIVRLVLNNFPVVLVEKYMRDMKANGVYCDTEKAGYLMGEYLAKRGMQKIGLLTYQPQFSIGVKERIFGFQSAIVSNSIPPLPSDQLLVVSNEYLDVTYQLQKNFIPPSIVDFVANHPDLEAIATIDALLAQFVCRALQETGRTDVMVVCCDEPVFHSEIFPAAYIEQSPYEMGSIAARMIVESVENNTTRHAIINPSLIELQPNKSSIVEKTEIFTA